MLNRRTARMYIRIARCLAREHIRSLTAAAVVLSVLLIATILIPSCGEPTRREPDESELPAPVPASPDIIRVRVMDPTDAATIHTTGPYRIVADGRTCHNGTRALEPTPLYRRGRTWRLGQLRVDATQLRIVPDTNAAFAACDGIAYRGALVVRPSPDSADQFTIDNHLPLEHYLTGVLARELLASWHVETYKALAVAARTYALYEMTHIGRRRSFDVYDDQRSQVYGGIPAETAKSIAAVKATYGMVLSVGAGGSVRVFKTYYSSCCGGRTCPAEGLEPQAEIVTPLAGGVICTDCSFSSRYRWDTVRIDRQAAFAAVQRTYPRIAEMGPIRSITVRSTTDWGRPQWLDVIAASGETSRIRADDLRLALLRSDVPNAERIYSMSCTLTDNGRELVFSDGRGFGHSVGLCQYGAEGKSRRGLPYYKTLYSYFPGATIVRAY